MREGFKLKKLPMLKYKYRQMLTTILTILVIVTIIFGIAFYNYTKQVPLSAVFKEKCDIDLIYWFTYENNKYYTSCIESIGNISHDMADGHLNLPRLLKGGWGPVYYPNGKKYTYVNYSIIVCENPTNNVIIGPKKMKITDGYCEILD